MARPRLLSLTAAALPAALAGCAPAAPPASPAAPGSGSLAARRVPAGPVAVGADPWVLSAARWDAAAAPAYLGNGYLGQRYSASGTGWSGGKPDPAHVAGVYRAESLVTLPPLTPLRVRVGSRELGADPARIRQYAQEVRLKEGVLVTRATWDGGAGEVAVESEAALLRQQPDVALLRVRVTNRGSQPVTLSLPEGVFGTAPAPLAAAFAGDGVRYTTRLTALEGGAGGAEGLSVPPGAAVEAAVATHVAGGPVRLRGALSTLPEIDAACVRDWLAGHRQAWARLWEADLEIEGDPEAQQVVRSCLFHLLCSVREENDAGVPPMGLSAPAFLGHVFWDMESWMLPALLPQRPELARAMLEYRCRTLPGARANARAEGLPGASYAWESGATGQETLAAGAAFRHGRHVTGDVVLAMRQYFRATGDHAWLAARAWPVLQATADNWAARARKTAAGFDFPQVTTPDENAGRVNRSAWTLHVARVNLEFAAEAARLLGRPASPRWSTVAKGLSFLKDPANGLILPYEGFKESTRAKQADLLLLGHPGEAGIPAAELGRLYDHYAPRVIEVGPAMTDAIHAVIAARLDRGDEALRRFRASFRPFVRPPFHLFSEKRTRDNLCFLTGEAGVLEAVLYGFAGLRLEPDPGAPERPRLEPHLPPGWTALRLRRLHWRGRRWDVELKPGAPPGWTPAGA